MSSSDGPMKLVARLEVGRVSARWLQRSGWQRPCSKCCPRGGADVAGTAARRSRRARRAARNYRLLFSTLLFSDRVCKPLLEGETTLLTPDDEVAKSPRITTQLAIPNLSRHSGLSKTVLFSNCSVIVPQRPIVAFMSSCKWGPTYMMSFKEKRNTFDMNIC